jgi:flavin-dependent dehydrogenase
MAARRAGVETKGGQEFRADLVIDAAGRRSPVPGWLAAGGFAPPRQVEVDPHVTYTSRLYRTPRQVGCPLKSQQLS